MQGLIIENKSNLYKIKIKKEEYTATARGKLKSEDLIPVVGDNVEFDIINNDSKDAVINKILERKNYIKRPKIANLTQMIYVISSKHPSPDLLLLDKQLAFSNFFEIKVIIVLNKIDLDDKNIFEKITKMYNEIGYEVIQTDAKKGIGINELKKRLKNNISAFSGNSGVGKSTLINNLFNKQITKEGEISLKNKKGKNTTTQIKLYEIEEKSYIADTPGFSTFDIYEIPYKELDKYFLDFSKYIDKCKYIGCSHIKENECGVKKALEENKISQNRYNNYIKIYNELKDKEEHKW